MIASCLELAEALNEKTCLVVALLIEALEEHGAGLGDI
jgi:hypothetical protein